MVVPSWNGKLQKDGFYDTVALTAWKIVSTSSFHLYTYYPKGNPNIQCQ